MNRKEAEYADLPLLIEDTYRPLPTGPATGWAALITPDPFENKCLVSENTPSPF